MNVSTREARDEDQAFVEAVQVAVLTEELGAGGWDPGLRDAIMGLQLEARRSCFESEYPDAHYQIVLADGDAAGILLVAHRESEIRLAEIAIVPERRGAGVGGAILAGLIAEAERAGKPLRLHVRHTNAAARLYLRMGFQVTAQDAMQAEMEYRREVRD